MMHSRGAPQAGVSLVELMVAVLIGSILMGAALSVFVESRATSQANQAVARLQENGVFAADEISRSLELAGYWGASSSTGLIGGRTIRTNGALGTASTLAAGTGNCTSTAGYPWYTDLSRPVEGFDTNGEPDGAEANDAFISCIPDSTYLGPAEGPAGASDILVVRYVEPEPVAVADLESNNVYIRSSPTGGQMFIGTTQPSGVSGSIYRLRAYAYYVSQFYENVGDGIPTLKRASLDDTGGLRTIPGATSPAVEDIVIPGIESFHVQFGIDTGGSGSANIYVNANSVAADQWDDVVAVRFWLIVRDEAAEKDFVNDASYTLPQRAFAPGGDAFRRVRISRTVQVRNIDRS